MTKRVAGRPFDEPCVSGRRCHRFLNYGLVEMVPTLLASMVVHPPVPLGKNELPSPFVCGIAVLAREGVRETHPPMTFGKISLMNGVDPSKMLDQRLLGRLRKHGDAILGTLAAPHSDLICPKVDVLHPQTQTFIQPEARAIHEARHDPDLPIESAHDRPDFLSRHDDGHTYRFSRSDHLSEIPDFTIQNVSIEKQQRAQCLVLRYALTFSLTARWVRN